MDLKQVAMNMLQSNPRFSNNPQAQEYFKVIQSGDNVRGEEIARNICNSMGIKPEDAYNQAKNFFHF